MSAASRCVAASGVSCDDQAIGEAHVDGGDVARQKPVVMVHPDQIGDRLILAILGKLDRDAVFQLQVPAPFADADIAFDPRGQLRIFLDLGQEIRRLGRRAGADDQRQQRLLAARERRDHGAGPLDDGKLGALLPERERLALLDAHLQRMRIDLAHRRNLDPGQRTDPLARGFGIEADQRRPAVELQPVQNVDLGGLAIADHLDLVDGKAGAGSDALDDAVDMPAEIGAIGAA